MIDREFRVGDKVTCVLFGKGIIERVSVKFIDVKFEWCYELLKIIEIDKVI